MAKDTSRAALEITPAQPADVGLILELVQELADYEKEPDAARATPDQIHQGLFGEKPAAECVIARFQGEPAGLALWFQNFSTWTGRPGLWLEDLFVRPAFRRQGIGRQLLRYLANIAQERGLSRLEWSVLDWNQLAVDFYLSLDAEPMDQWTTFRLSGDPLARLAAEGA